MLTYATALNLTLPHFLNCTITVCGFEYNATNLLVELDSFKEKRVTKIVFANVFSYRVTLEHFRWAEFCYNPNISATLVNVKESHYIKWLETAGLEQIYESKLDLRHYMLQTTEHTIDVVFPSESIITIDGKEI